MITQQELHKILSYDPETGEFFWKVRTSIRVKKVGSRAGSSRRDGYVEIRISGKSYLAHRLAHLYMTGQWPVKHVDHIDGSPSNNRWRNLRQATVAQNHANSRLYKTNTSGIKGVVWDRERRKWIAQITHNQKMHHLGRFEDIESARTAYATAANAFFGTFARVV